MAASNGRPVRRPARYVEMALAFLRCAHARMKRPASPRRGFYSWLPLIMYHRRERAAALAKARPATKCRRVIRGRAMLLARAVNRYRGMRNLVEARHIDKPENRRIKVGGVMTNFSWPRWR